MAKKQVRRDAIQPGAGVRTGTQPNVSAERPQEHVLEQVLHRRGIAREPARVAHDLGPVRVDQLAKVDGSAHGTCLRHSSGGYNLGVS